MIIKLKVVKKMKKYIIIYYIIYIMSNSIKSENNNKLPHIQMLHQLQKIKKKYFIPPSKNKMSIRFNKNTLFSEYLHLIFYQYLLVKILY
jgi:hypothetical protein